MGRPLGQVGSSFKWDEESIPAECTKNPKFNSDYIAGRNALYLEYNLDKGLPTPNEYYIARDAMVEQLMDKYDCAPYGTRVPDTPDGGNGGGDGTTPDGGNGGGGGGGGGTTPGVDPANVTEDGKTSPAVLVGVALAAVVLGFAVFGD
jgi:hypothetical protein